MKRLAMIDGLLVATFATLLMSLGICFGGRVETVAHASYAKDDCLPPATCPAKSGNCAGCLAGFQTGVCTVVNYNMTCEGGGANCMGTDTVTRLTCNCSANACMA